jgi:hypothetical protein
MRALQLLPLERRTCVPFVRTYNTTCRHSVASVRHVVADENEGGAGTPRVAGKRHDAAGVGRGSGRERQTDRARDQTKTGDETQTSNVRRTVTSRFFFVREASLVPPTPLQLPPHPSPPLLRHPHHNHHHHHHHHLAPPHPDPQSHSRSHSHSFALSLPHSLSITHSSFIHSFIHSFIDLSLHWLVVGPVKRSMSISLAQALAKVLANNFLFSAYCCATALRTGSHSTSMS